MYYRIFFVFLVGGADGAMGLGAATFIKILIEGFDFIFIMATFLAAPPTFAPSPHFYIFIYLCNISLKEYLLIFNE